MHSTKLPGALLLLGWIATAHSAIGFGQGPSIQGEERHSSGTPVAVIASAAVADVPVASSSPEFELGIGDVIHVSVWREPELTETAVVRPDGRISIPLAGEVSVAGKSTRVAQAEIRTLLLTYVTDPHVTVSIIEIHSRQVFITGQVQHPGAYPIVGEFNVLQLIASAGGLTPYARKKGIVILDSGNRQVSRFDYSSAVKGNEKQTMMLHPGETVVVP